MLKRALSPILALILCLGILAGCQQTPAETSTPADTAAPAGTTAPAETTVPQETEPEKLYFEEPLVIDMVRPVVPAAPDVSYIVDLLKETLNVEIKLNELDNLDEQYSLMLNDNKLPSVTWINSSNYGNQYGAEGAYINIMDYLDQMPNFKAALEANPRYIDFWQNPDGSMYHIPCIYINGESTTRAFFYREDILAKHNLTWPTTREGLEELLRELKKLYPDSYPMCVRYLGGTHITNVVDWGVAFGAKLTFSGRDKAYTNYNNETGKWYEGATAPEMKEMISWLKDMMEEGLIHPSGPTMTTGEWQAYLSTSESFIGWDRMDHIAAINTEGVKTNAEFSLVGATPIQMAEAGHAAYLAPSVVTYSYLISSNAERLDDILAFIDWLYSEEGIMITNYGKKDETYTLDAEGNPVWTDACKAEEHPQLGRGMTSGGFYGIFDFNSYVGWQSDAMQRTYETITPYATVPNYYPSMVGKYNETEQATIDAYGAAYQTFVKGELVKFLLGERDLSEWDAFVQEATTTYHGADLVAVSQSAWDRANAG